MKKLYSIIFLVFFVFGSSAFADRDFFIRGVVTTVDSQLNSISIKPANGPIKHIRIQDYSIEIDGIRSDISKLRVGSTIGMIYEIDDDTNLAESVHIAIISN